MPKLTGVAAVLVAVLLTGCAATPSANGTPEPALTGTAETGIETVPPTAEPLVAETTEPATSDDQFLAYVRDNLPPNTVIPNATDQQLLDAAMRACAEIESGVDTIQLSLIEGEPQDASGFYPDSAVIITAARMFICAD